MKMFPKLLIVAVSIVITTCGDSLKTARDKKAIVDRILKGESVNMKELPTEDRINFLHPRITAMSLGYSEEDLKKLEEVIIKLQEPKTPESPNLK